MLLSESNFEEVGVPLIDLSDLKKLLVKAQKKTKKKRKKPSKKAGTSREELFKKILAEVSLEPEEDEESEDDQQDSEDEVVVIKKKATKTFESKDEVIKIASTKIKDSHYQIDVSKDLIKKEGKNLIMVSAYVREGYIGQYLIKRNYYYHPKNSEAANETFDEIVKKMKRIKSAYHQGSIEIKAVTSNIFRVFNGIISDVRFDNEDEVGTTVKRRFDFIT